MRTIVVYFRSYDILRQYENNYIQIILEQLSDVEVTDRDPLKQK